jgi:alcohol dehydrogenase class IV
MPCHAEDLPTSYDFAMPPMIRFGAGRIGEIGELVGLWGREAWIVGGGRSLVASGAKERIETAFAAAGIPHRRVATAAGEPTVDHVAGALASLPRGDRSGVVVVAVGGGSTIDLAKAVAALVPLLPASIPTEDLDALVVDHLEGVGRGLAIRHWPLPVVAVPTTAGTGAEATRNAVISCPRRGFKKSMRSPLMVPRAALVDPELTASCDRGTVLASGLDCITQLVESYVCRFARPLPRGLVLEALPGALRALPRLLAAPAPGPGGDDRVADRAAMSHAALVSGVALANSGLGLAHGVAAALGIACGTPHGIACATMLPAALRVNRAACAHDLATLERAADAAAPACDAAAADAFVDRIDRLCADAPRRLGDIGVRADQLDWLAEHSGGNSMRGNPVQLDTAAIRRLLADMM